MFIFINNIFLIKIIIYKKIIVINIKLKFKPIKTCYSVFGIKLELINKCITGLFYSLEIF